MLITFSSRILARFHTGPPEILADGNFAFRPDLSKILTARGFVSRRESRQHSHRDIRLPAKNPGKTPAGILPRFWPPGIPSPGKIPTGSRRDFGRRESRLPPRIPARFPPGSRRDFGRRESRLPLRIPARFPPGSCRDFGRRESRLPPRIPVRIPAGTGNPGGNLAGILARSRQDPGTIFTRVNVSDFYCTVEIMYYFEFAMFTFVSVPLRPA